MAQAGDQLSPLLAAGRRAEPGPSSARPSASRHAMLLLMQSPCLRRQTMNLFRSTLVRVVEQNSSSMFSIRQVQPPAAKTAR